MRTSMAPREQILFSMVRDPNKIPRISSEFQSRERKGSLDARARRCKSRPCGGALFDCERGDDRSRGKCYHQPK
jgi:hypothetical protein